MTRVEKIRAILQQSFDPIELIVEDESAQHAGHAGARDGRGHFRVTIVSPVFRGKSLLLCHRLVYESLQSLLETDIHALGISARSPQEI